MILLLKLTCLTFIWVFAFQIATSKGMLLENVGAYIDKQVEAKKKVFKLLECPWCMPTLFSLFGFISAIGIGIINISWNFFVYYPLTVMASSFVCGMTWLIYTTINSVKEYYDNAQKYYYLLNKSLKEKYKKENS